MDVEIKRKYLEAGRIGKKALELGASLIEPGAKLIDVANAMEKFVIDEGAKPAFPVNLSINNEAAHYTPGIGDKKVFRTGDVVKVDFGAHIDGYMSDTAITVEVGGQGKHSDLIDAAKEALNAAIEIVRPLRSVNEIGRRIAEVIGSYGFRPVRNLGGHGVERYDLHASTFIPNYDDGNVVRLNPDHAYAIEPFASTGIGLIHEGQPGNIYMIDRPKPREDETIYMHFNKLPFAERWLEGMVDDPKSYIRKMMASKEVYSFPVLKEHSGSFISQFEHTIIILADEVIVTTK